MIIKVSRDMISGRRSICSGGAAVYTGCPVKDTSCPAVNLESIFPRHFSSQCFIIFAKRHKLEEIVLFKINLKVRGAYLQSSNLIRQEKSLIFIHFLQYTVFHAPILK